MTPTAIKSLSIQVLLVALLLPVATTYAVAPLELTAEEAAILSREITKSSAKKVFCELVVKNSLKVCGPSLFTSINTGDLIVRGDELLVGDLTVNGAVTIAGISIGTPQYAYLASTLTGALADNAPVPFDAEGVKSAGIIHSTAVNNQNITVAQSGIYSITYVVTGNAVPASTNRFSEFVIEINGVQVPNSASFVQSINNASLELQNSGQVLVSLNALTDVVTLNTLTGTAINFLPYTAGNGVQSNPAATLIITKVA